MKFIAILFLLILCFRNSRSEVIRLNTQSSLEKSCNYEAAMLYAKQDILNTLNNRYCPLLNNTVRPTTASRCYGYCAGLEWDDLADTCDRIIGIRAIEIYYDHHQVNSIQVSYLLAGGSEVSAARHGHSAGSRVLIRLGNNESIKVVEGSSRNNSISHLTFTSENERGNKTVHGPYGQTGQERFAVNGYILGLKGFSNNSVNGIGVYYLPPLFKSNSTIGGCFNTLHDDKVDSIIPPVVGISRIKIHHGTFLDGIQFTYLLLDGSLHRGNIIGGTGGNPTLLELFPEEEIYAAEVATSNDDIVGILSIFTRLNESTRTRGPYGQYSNRNRMRVSGKILGFYGYSREWSSQTHLLCRIGVYTIN